MRRPGYEAKVEQSAVAGGAGGNGEESGDEEMRRWEDYFIQMK
jgi:hypothetical protein